MMDMRPLSRNLVEEGDTLLDWETDLSLFSNTDTETEKGANFKEGDSDEVRQEWK